MILNCTNIIKTICGTVYVINSNKLNVYKSNFKSKRDFERTCLKEIINKILGNYEVTHEINGAPYIKSKPEIKLSISHSNNWFSIYISNNETIGVDIQVFDKEIKNNGEYFINQYEALNLELTKKNIHLIWCIKEALYKKLCGNIKDFKNDIIVVKIESEIIQLKYLSTIYKLKYLITTEFYLVYTI